MGRPRRKSDAGHYRRHQVMHGMRIVQSTLQTAPITFFMNFCLRMLSVVTTVSDFSLELERAAYGYRADYYLGVGKRDAPGSVTTRSPNPRFVSVAAELSLGAPSASPLLLLARSFRTKFVLGVVLWIAASRDKEYGVTR